MRYFLKGARRALILPLLFCLAGNAAAQPDGAMSQALQGFDISPETASRLLDLARDSDVLKKMGKPGAAALMLDPQEKEAVLDVLRRIAEIPPTKRPKDRVSLAEFMQPLFVQAQERAAAGQSARQENRAVFLALSLYVNKLKASEIFGEEGRGAAPLVDPEQVQLFRRRDLAQHFATAAALALTVGPEQADRIGMDKELSDMRKKSGFSFSDLAADRAGIKLAMAATASEEEARRFQGQLAGNRSEAAIMPSVMGLPDGLNEAEFNNHFQKSGSERFERMLAGINEKIDALPVYARNN